ncbi:MAG: response regulator [Spirochaetaceae bacterium]|jgi:CheY-like chemotaxis protein|nr:response regulator [Spirochaetaceae bacterium]
MKTIIHADNSEFFRKLVKTFLTEHGYESDSLELAKEALEIINAGQVGLIITGLSFSDMEGADFVKRIAGSPYTVPIIALTANESPEIERELSGLVKGWVHKSGAWQEQILPMIKQYFNRE